MRTNHRPLLAAAIALLLTAALPAAARAVFTLNVQPDGKGDIVEIGSGTLDVVSLTQQPNLSLYAYVYPASTSGAVIVNGPTASTPANLYTGVSGTSFYTGPSSGAKVLANSGSGDLVGITEGFRIDVPAGYVSGNPLSDTATFNNTTLAALGLAPGTYTSTWGSGATADSFILNITNTPLSVPEPSTWAMLGAGVAVFAAWTWQQRRA